MIPLPTVTADVDLAVAGRRLQARLEVPAGPTPLLQLLPIARGLEHASVSAAVEDAAAAGMPLSCRAGCAACCRHMVPLSVPEAYHIRDLVERLPEPRRGEVRARFAAARRRLEQAGLLADLLAPRPFGPGEAVPHADDYFSLGLACPFLEEESCSIYEERPLICREYVVVSPPEHCARPRWAGVQVLKLPLEVWRAFARTAIPRDDGRLEWLALIVAPEWADSHPPEQAMRSGPELLQKLFAELTGKVVPPPPAP
jgi:Fe-S-cluster containining protein